MPRLTALPGDASIRMSRQRTRNTNPELLLRGELHSRGLRYRLHRRPLANIRREADLVFVASRVAVFVDGCFWHGCPEHGTWPKRNGSFWIDKIEGNRMRDETTVQALEREGWAVVRVWEHELAADAADRIEGLVRSRSPHSCHRRRLS
jgi:DNA mismatch endonuclease, patch repair protein